MALDTPRRAWARCVRETHNSTYSEQWEGGESAAYVTRFGSLDDYEKGGVEVINDDPRNYAFSNVFDVATKAKPYEKVAVAKNMQYVPSARMTSSTYCMFLATATFS